ncbi:DUF4396 domain-containing protein [Nocardioides sp.]|uniref:DUF4396 domain-containing protein n=1 Tax=Nocardioides sp. TaxID=35761 RepID=UPI002B923484|nr:DUF4396 domain-containing protein [Nocardioides sp.]HXH80337.1 DUF4396 domain-containing protein [Nocardioides sp.]
MTMESAVPAWLTPVAWTFLTLSVLSAAFIAADIYLGRRRHTSVANELVWIASGLYLGPFAIAFYLSRGRTSTSSAPAGESTGKPADTAVALLPGGGASAVAHLVAVPFVVAVGWTIAGLAMWPMIILIAVLVVIMVAVYERVASSEPRPGHAHRLSVGAAIGAAVITVVAFDIGMVGWMLLLHFNNAMPAVTESTFWFLMQLGVLVGLLTGYPAVKWLLSRNQSVVPA